MSDSLTFASVVSSAAGLSQTPQWNVAPVDQTPAQPHAQTQAASGPTVGLDLGQNDNDQGYVIDWRDPATKQLLVQLPVRQALGAAASMVGRHIDTAV